MSADLSDRLAEVVGSEGRAPDLGALWARGRGRRRRRRVATGLGAVALVAVVVVSGVALAGRGGEDEGVVAGPGSSVAVPPAEPADLPVRMVVEAGPPRDGVSTLEAGDPILVSYLGYDDGWGRGVSVDWEAWDGSFWEQTHTLVLGRGPDGSDGQVVPVGDELMVHAAGMLGSGPDRFRTPSDAGPGWYRVCVEVSGGGDSSGPDVEEPPGVSSSVPVPSSEDDSPPGSVLDPETGGSGSPRTVRPCAQLRVVGPGEAPPEGGAMDEPAPVRSSPP